jgi:arylsulfatase
LLNNTELFDLQADPGETTNVIGKFPEVVEDMRKAYDLWWEETKPLMVNEDVPLSTVRPYYEMYYKQEKERGIPEWDEPEI